MIKGIWITLFVFFILFSLNGLYRFWQNKKHNSDGFIHRKYKRSLIYLVFSAALLASFPFTQAFIPYYAFELGGQGLEPQALKGLNDIRKKTKKRWVIYSGYRAPEHNQKVGGASQSQHVKGVAFDVKVPHDRRAKFYEAAKDAGFTAFGWGNNTVHIDMGPARWWTYDERGRAASGQKKYQYLHKAPENFRQDLGL